MDASLNWDMPQSPIFSQKLPLTHPPFPISLTSYWSSAIHLLTLYTADLSSTNCCSDLPAWMALRHLKLNMAKTECLVFHRNLSLPVLPPYLSTMSHPTVIQARSLGFVFDTSLSIHCQVLPLLPVHTGRIPSFSSSSAKSLLYTLVISHIYHCNLLTGLLA